jgi:hypothetical protein
LEDAMHKLTNEANTHDWLTVSRGMKIRAYIGTNFLSTTQMPPEPEKPSDEPIFGANIKDAIRITKDWLSSRD